MVSLRLLLVFALGSSALYAQIPETRQDPWTATPPDNSVAAFSLSGPLEFRSALAQAPEMPHHSFSLKDSSAPHTPIVPPASTDLGTAALPRPGTQAPSAQTTAGRPKAVSYSNGYILRSKIHKYASFATLPLFAAEAVVGQKLYDENESDSSLRSVHSGLAYGIVGLFGANAVTGVWNLWEGRKDPHGHGKRLFHGILMLGASAGFVATAALAPHEEEGERSSSNDRSLHRNVAIVSMGVATVGYIYMLLAR
jgi:hypothetical protein